MCSPRFWWYVNCSFITYIYLLKYRHNRALDSFILPFFRSFFPFMWMCCCFCVFFFLFRSSFLRFIQMLTFLFVVEFHLRLSIRRKLSRLILLFDNASTLQWSYYCQVFFFLVQRSYAAECQRVAQHLQWMGNIYVLEFEAYAYGWR